MSKYEAKHRPENQKRSAAGFCINPLLRKNFDATAHCDRDPQEIEDWWARPFILEVDYQDADKNYPAYVSRMKAIGFKVDDEATWREEAARQKSEFMATHPNGKFYILRSLDGGAWDRSTFKGNFESLESVVEAAKAIDGMAYNMLNYEKVR